MSAEIMRELQFSHIWFLRKILYVYLHTIFTKFVYIFEGVTVKENKLKKVLLHVVSFRGILDVRLWLLILEFTEKFLRVYVYNIRAKIKSFQFSGICF